MTINDLRPGKCELILFLRRGERKRVTGEVAEKNGRKHLYARCSPRNSFGPGTKVIKILKRIQE